MKLQLKHLVVITVIFLSACLQDDEVNTLQPVPENTFADYVDNHGTIRRPENFRETWVHLGSWFVAGTDMATNATMHDVYATPEAVQSYRKNGEWPDGAVLVKTVSSVHEKQLTTGNAHWTGDVEVWFVMIRDRHNRFPNNQAWGEGWGWALFEAKDPEQNVTTNWKGTGFNNCFGCHAPAQNSEWVYIDGYPTVRSSARYPKLGGETNSLSMKSQ